MKNLKKIFAIAMSVATVAMSTSAFAATYDAEAPAVALTETEIATLDSYAGQMTVVVVPKTFGETSTAADIYYINQDEAGEAFDAIIADMGVKAALDETKEWEVRIGGTNVAEVLTFDIVFKEDGPVIVYGNVNNDAEGVIDGMDAIVLAQYLAEMDVDINIEAANVAYDFMEDGKTPKVDGLDAIRLAQYLAEMDVVLGPAQ